MKRSLICAVILALSPLAPTAALAGGGTAGALAALNALLQKQSAASGPTQAGQPDQTCGSDQAPDTPGNAASAPGSAFNPNGTAGGVYAGQQPQNSRNPMSVSQYDVACFHQPLP